MLLIVKNIAARAARLKSLGFMECFLIHIHLETNIAVIYSEI